MTRVVGFQKFLIESVQRKGDLTSRQISFLNYVVSKKDGWSYDENTGLVNIPNGTLEINGNAAIDFPELLEPRSFLGLSFGYVGKSVWIVEWNVPSLEGAPQKVDGQFDCCNCGLLSLKGGPIEVGHNFHCRGNALNSLEGSPRRVGGDFVCWDNPLETFEGLPEEVGGRFVWQGDVTSWEGVDIKAALYGPVDTERLELIPFSTLRGILHMLPKKRWDFLKENLPIEFLERSYFEYEGGPFLEPLKKELLARGSDMKKLDLLRRAHSRTKYM